jgi:Flp pilus assembly protein TadG
MSFLRDDRGLAAISTIALLPLLIVVLAGVLQLGALRVSVARVQAAADLATLIAVNDQDDGELARTGSLRLADDAADVAREYFARELDLSAALLAAVPDEIAGSADVAAFPVAPTLDPRSGARYEHPAVRIAAQVPLRTPILGALAFGPVTTVGIFAVSSPR